jgi:nucleoside-diphosphate-sugar epimerase
VLGTIHVFEAAKALALERVVYASSAAVYGPPLGGEVPDEHAATEPRTHYGVYKRANEQGAYVYWRDDRVASVGLRPLAVYGVGRDQGLTSGPTSAMKAAVLGRSFHIAFRGATDFCYVADAAAAFLASADRAPAGAHVFNLHGITAELERLVELFAENAPDARGRITFDGPELPLPPELDGGAIERALPGLPKTALADGVRETMERFRALLVAGRLDVRDV